jgi:voltage-gated potassium channel
MFSFWFLRRRARAKPIIAPPSIGKALLRAGALILALGTLHVLAMMAYEAMPPFDAFWLTLTTLFTVGYGDIFAKTFEGRWATILLLYFGGIFTLANFASQWFEWRADAKMRKWRGQWRWRMKEHLVILNSPAEHPQEYFERLVQELRRMPRFAQCPILIITRAFEQGLPESLAKLGVAHLTAWGLDFHALRDASAEHARAIAILAKSEIEPTSDSITLDAVTRVRSVSQAHLVVECLDERNRARMIRAGASAVVRPTRVYPEIMARALSHPGSEKVLEEILDAGGAECARIDEAWEGAWRDLVRRFCDEDAGTPIGYEDLEGKVHVNPKQGEQVRARAIFALVNDEGAGAGGGRAPYDRRAA